MMIFDFSSSCEKAAQKKAIFGGFAAWTCRFAGWRWWRQNKNDSCFLSLELLWLMDSSQMSPKNYRLLLVGSTRLDESVIWSISSQSASSGWSVWLSLPATDDWDDAQ